MTAATCAICRRQIDGASPRVLGAHSTCWRAAGGRIRRLSPARVLRIEAAANDAWRAEFDRAHAAAESAR